MQELDLRWWSASELASLAARVDARLSEWCADWGIAVRAPSSCVNAHAADPVDGWRPWAGEVDVDAWYASTPTDVALACALFGVHGGMEASALAAGVADHAMADWLQRFGNLLPALPSVAYGPLQPPEAQMRCWSGAVRVTVPMPDADFLVHLGPRVATALMPERRAAQDSTPLAAIRDAVTPCRLPLRVLLEEVELDLGSYLALAVGDVIRLPHPLDQPLRAETTDGTFRCAAWLGRRGATKAIELARPPARS